MSHIKVISKLPSSSDIRDCNLILFGLPEGKSIVDTKESVDEMFEFLVGKSVIVKDMFRLGKYGSSRGAEGPHRPRPVLIKLTTPWDRKLILLQKSNLRNFKIPRLFLREDLPPEHKLRVKNLKTPSKVVVQPLSSDPPPDSGTSIALQGKSNQSQSHVATPSSIRASSSRESLSPRASLASSHAPTPDHSRSPSPAESNSSASSSSTVVQGVSSAS